MFSLRNVICSTNVLDNFCDVLSSLFFFFLINIILLRLGCYSENYEIQESFEAQFTHARGNKYLIN